MATVKDFAFLSYAIASGQGINAAQVTRVAHFRDRHGNHIRAQPGDYVIKDEDGALRMMPKARFEAEYTANNPPTAPNTLTTSGRTASTIDLSWTVGSASAIPCIEQDSVEIHRNAANDGTYTVPGLAPNTGYAFRVRNSLNEALSAYTNVLTAYTLPGTISAAPTATEVTDESMRVSWVNITPSAETDVEIDDGAGGEFTLVETVAPGVFTLVIDGLDPETTYRVRVRHRGAVSDYVSASYSPNLSQATTA